MILLDHSIPLVHEAESLFEKWEFWLAAFTVVGGFIGNWYRQAGLITVLKIEIENNEEKCDAKIQNLEKKFDARIDSTNTQITRDRDSAGKNYETLFNLLTDMNKRLDKVIDGAK